MKTRDFSSSTSNLIRNDVRLIDFDQSFIVSSPPDKILSTPVEFLAPEVAVGLPASPRAMSGLSAVAYSDFGLGRARFRT
jgi:hypothetical protein